MWLLIDIDNGEVIYENKDRAEVEKKREYYINGDFREEDHYIIISYDK